MHLIPNSYGVKVREFNTCHQPAGSAKGGQFGSKDSGSCATGEQTPAPQHLLGPGQSPLLTSAVNGYGELGGGVSVSMVVTLADGSRAAYKPEVGEVWMDEGWGNPDIGDAIMPNPNFTQAAREAAAYQVDQLLGTDLVPETVLREEVDVEVEMPEDDGMGGGGYGHDTLQQMYDDWKQGAWDRGEYDDRVSEIMLEKYDEERGDFIKGMDRHDDAITELWNEVVDEHPTFDDDYVAKYGFDADKQPALQLGSDEEDLGFHPKILRSELDPLDVLKDSGADLTGPLSVEEKASIKALLTKAYVEDGFRNLGMMDSEKAGELFKEFGDWISDHGDTEANVMGSVMDSYTAWKQKQGVATQGSNAGDGNRLGSRAPHPNGGSLQRMVPHARHYGDLDGTEMTKFAILDYALGSMDRHSSNTIWDHEDRAYAIDNGMTFPRYNGITFRSNPTVEFIRNSARTDKPFRPAAALLQTFAKNVNAADWDGFLSKQEGMSSAEKTAFKKRIETLNRALQSPDGLYRLWAQQSIM